MREIRTSEGLKLYIKANHKWHGVKVGESFDSLEKKINEIKSKVDTIKQFRLPSTYSVTGDFILDASGDIELNADGATVTFKDNTVTNYTFEGGLNPVMTMNSLTVGDSFSITLNALGHATLATVDNSSDVGHLILDADGDVVLDAVMDSNGGVFFKDSGTSVALMKAHHTSTRLLLYEAGGTSTDDYLEIRTEASGATTISTVDAAAAAGHLKLDVDGDITLDSHTGEFIASKAGTEFSATNSAYAGMILGYTRIFNLSSTIGHNVITVNNSSMTVLQTSQGTDVKVQFIVPPSGNVEIECTFWSSFSSRGAKFSLSDNASYNEIAFNYTYDADWTIYNDETDHHMHRIVFGVSGLTAGTDTTYFLAGLASSTFASILHGKNRSANVYYPPIIMKATALPATIVTGE